MPHRLAPLPDHARSGRRAAPRRRSGRRRVETSAGLRILGLGAIVVALAGLAGASWGVSAVRDQGRIALFGDSTGSAVFGPSAAPAPGLPSTECLAVRAGSASRGDQVLLAATSGAGDLASELSVTVDLGQGGGAGDCGGFVGTTVWTGTLADLVRSGDGVRLGWYPADLPVRSFRISATTTSAGQSGHRPEVDLVWRLVPGSVPASSVDAGAAVQDPTGGLGAGTPPQVEIGAAGRFEEFAQLSAHTVVLTVRSAHFVVAAIVLAFLFVLVNDQLARRDPKLVLAARRSRERDLVYADLLPPARLRGQP